MKQNKIKQGSSLGAGRSVRRSQMALTMAVVWLLSWDAFGGATVDPFSASCRLCYSEAFHHWTATSFGFKCVFPSQLIWKYFLRNTRGWPSSHLHTSPTLGLVWAKCCICINTMSDAHCESLGGDWLAAAWAPDFRE